MLKRMYPGISEEELRNLPKEALEAIAGVVGTTAAELGEVDKKNVGDRSPGTRALKINAHQIMKDVINNQPNIQQQNQPSAARTEVVETFRQPITQQPAPFTGNAVQMVMLDTATVQLFKDEIKALKDQMVTLTSYIEALHSTEESIQTTLEQALLKGAKAITIKFNDSNNKEQEDLRQ